MFELVISVLSAFLTRFKSRARLEAEVLALRWTAAGMLEAEKTFRKLKAYRQLPILRKALEDHMRQAHAHSAVETIMQAA